MAYYLTIKERQNYKLLDISNMKQFKRISKFKRNTYSLEEIDIFTSSFQNELTLKRVLYEQGIINLDEISKEISIRRKNKNEMIKVMYDLVYSYNKKYIDEIYIRMKLLELQNDKMFLNKLLNHYRNNYKQDNLAQIRAALEGYTDINLYEALNSFYIDEVYDIDRGTGQTKIKYKSMHDLGMFIYNYLTKKDKSDIDTKILELEIIKDLEDLKTILTPTQVVVKKRVKKLREELDGQQSFLE